MTTAVRHTWHATALLAGAVALLLLSACTATPVRDGLTEAEKAALTPEMQLWAAEADYLMNKADFAEYAEQDKCVPPEVVACHDPKVVIEVRKLDKQVREAFRVARMALGTGDAATKASAARSLLAIFAARVALLMVTGG